MTNGQAELFFVIAEQIAAAHNAGTENRNPLRDGVTVRFKGSK